MERVPTTEPERRLVSFIDSHNPEAEKLLERVVDINSGTMNFEVGGSGGHAWHVMRSLWLSGVASAWGPGR